MNDYITILSIKPQRDSSLTPRNPNKENTVVTNYRVSLVSIMLQSGS